MKKALAVAAAILIFGALAAPAGAARGSTSAVQAQIAALKRQVSGLQKQVTALKKKVNNKNSGLTPTYQLALFGSVFAVCETALTADAFQATWQAVNQATGKTVFGTESQLDDFSTCANGFRVSRTQTNPPTLAPFKALMTSIGRASFSPLTPWWQQPLWG